jgi:hypothetical protein
LCEVFLFLVSAAESEQLCRLRTCSVNFPRLVYSSCLLLNFVHQALYEALMVINFKQNLFVCKILFIFTVLWSILYCKKDLIKVKYIIWSAYQNLPKHWKKLQSKNFTLDLAPVVFSFLLKNWPQYIKNNNHRCFILSLIQETESISRLLGIIFVRMKWYDTNVRQTRQTGVTWTVSILAFQLSVCLISSRD